jgi:hypothetical protein
VQRGQTLRRRGIAFVGEIVGAAGEGVDRFDRRAQIRRFGNRTDATGKFS